MNPVFQRKVESALIEFVQERDEILAIDKLVLDGENLEYNLLLKRYPSKRLSQEFYSFYDKLSTEVLPIKGSYYIMFWPVDLSNDSSREKIYERRAA